MKDVQIRKIFYNDASFNLIKPPYIPLDNTGGDKTWFEFLPILEFLKKNKLEENIFYGFFSPKFYEKTGFDSDFISKALAENVDKDVLLFSPAWDQLCLYVNPWEQGEQHHKGITKATQDFLNYINHPIEILNLVSTTHTSVFSNFVVAKAEYWDKWLVLASKFFEYCNDSSNILSQISTLHRDDFLPLKVFIQERFPSIILADKTFKTAAFKSKKPMVFQGYQQELLRCDFLKESMLNTGVKKKLVDEYQALRWGITNDIRNATKRTS